MEDNQILDDDFQSKEGLVLTTTAEAHLRTAAQWAKIVAIAGFIKIGFEIINLIKTIKIVPSPLLIILAIAGIVISLALNITLLKFAINTRKGKQASFNYRGLGLENLSTYLGIWGGLIIFFLVLFAIGLVIGLLGFIF